MNQCLYFLLLSRGLQILLFGQQDILIPQFLNKEQKQKF